MASGCCPKTFTGFCLADNTPIAITLDNGVVISWTNLVTGVVTPGNPPAGTGICEVPSTVEVEVEIAPLTCEKDSVTVCPPVSGTFDVEVVNSVTVLQGTDPWVVAGDIGGGGGSGTEFAEDSPHATGDLGTLALVVRNDAGTSLVDTNLDYAPLQVDATGALRAVVTGTVSVTEPVTVDGTVALDAGTLAALETTTVNQGTSPWVVSGTVTVNEPVTVDGTVALDAPTLAALETITVNQGTSPWVVSGTVSVTEPVTVDAVDLDVRNLLFATDKVDVSGSTVNITEPVTVDGTVGISGTVPVSGPLTDAELRASPVPVTSTPSISPYTTDAQTVAVVGPTAVVTPGAGNQLRIRWLFAQAAAANIGTVVVTFRLDATVIYRFELDAGQPFAHTTIVEGAADEVLTVELSNALSSVFINVDYEEF